MPARPAPVIILCEPQLGQNIGAVARAMLNCGLTELRLVAPRDGWPSKDAVAAAAGADLVIDGTRVFDTARDAIADLTLVFATTARSRDMAKPVLAPDAALDRAVAAEGKVGVLFGCERSGLSNDQVALADAAVTFPLNPGFSSLNLAQAVLLIAWEWRRSVAEPAPAEALPAISPASTHGERDFLFDHLVRELDAGGFFFPEASRPHMLRNLRNLITRAAMTQQDVRTLHGVIVSLSDRRRHRREAAEADR